MFVYSHILFFHFVLLQGAPEHLSENVWVFCAAVFVDEINHLLSVPHISIRGMEWFGG
jgi:hypothetical protein